MRGELFVLNGKLSFFFKKSDVKTTADKEAIRKMIYHLFHTHSIWAQYTLQDVEDIIKKSKSVHIGISMNDDEQSPDLKIYNYSGRDYKIVQLIHEKGERL